MRLVRGDFEIEGLRFLLEDHLRNKTPVAQILLNTVKYVKSATLPNREDVMFLNENTKNLFNHILKEKIENCFINRSSDLDGLSPIVELLDVVFL